MTTSQFLFYSEPAAIPPFYFSSSNLPITVHCQAISDAYAARAAMFPTISHFPVDEPTYSIQDGLALSISPIRKTRTKSFTFTVNSIKSEDGL